MNKTTLLAAALIAACAAPVFGQAGGTGFDAPPPGGGKAFSVDIAPDIEFYALHFGRMVSRNEELVGGFSYLNTSIMKVLPYPGHQEVITLELAYRRYLIENFHMEVQIDPQYFWCHDAASGQTTGGFGLTTEFRLGYRFDIPLAGQLFYLNIQFFMGYHLINPKPANFQAADPYGSFYLSPIPMFALGWRF